MSIPVKPSVANTDLTLLTSWGGQQVPYSTAQKASGYGAGTLLGRNLAATSLNWQNAYWIEWLARANNAIDYIGQNVELYTDDGIANSFALTVNSGEPITSYSNGLKVRFFAKTANDHSCSVTVDGLSSKNIKDLAGNDLVSGDIQVGQYVEIVYDSTNNYFVLANPLILHSVTAENTSYDNTVISGGLTATNIQDAIDEIMGLIQAL